MGDIFTEDRFQEHPRDTFMKRLLRNNLADPPVENDLECVFDSAVHLFMRCVVDLLMSKKLEVLKLVCSGS